MDIDIDISSHKRDIVFQKILEYYKKQGGDAVRVGTFRTETSKSALNTACRGLEINNDIASYMTSLIPQERGILWSIKDCYYGNKEKNREPIKEFVNLIDNFKEKDNIDLLGTVLKIEGIVSGRSSHAAGIVLSLGDIADRCAIMKTPSGERITQFDLSDCENCCGLIKYDILITEASSCIQIALELMLKDKAIEWKGSLRETYNYYFNPKNLIDNKEIWKLLCEHKLLNAFQYEGDTGEQAINSIKIESFVQAVAGNSVMRLMKQGEEKYTPLELYSRYKENIELWYQEMRDYGLTEEEIEICKSIVGKDYGVMNTQENMMECVMDNRVANFTVPEANIARKGVAKKKVKLFKKAEELFYKKGRELGASSNLLRYLWEIQICKQKGYAFSTIHCIEYTYVLLTELNMIYRFNPIYWNCANLIISSTSYETENKKSKTTNYGKIGSAIGLLQSHGTKITFPDINKAELGFVPDATNNNIIFGLGGIIGINNETANIIIKKRPYNSVLDFHKRLVEEKRIIICSTGKTQMKSYLSSSQVISLIKAGAFDEIEEVNKNKTRKDVLVNYLKMLFPPKINLKITDIKTIYEFGLLPNEFEEELKLYNFKEYFKSLSKIDDEESNNIKWVILEDGDNTDYITQFFLNNFSCNMIEGKDYRYNSEGYIEIAIGTTRKGSFEDIYKNKIKHLLKWLKTDECKNRFNDILFETKTRNILEGSISDWEMESLSYYYHEHPLSIINKDKYKISNFFDLPMQPIETGEYNYYKNVAYPKFKLNLVAGTVLDKDKNKHIVTLLTEYGVIIVKFYSGAFSHYNKVESYIDNEGNKIVVEKSWFERGNKLLICGYRRENQFRPKKYKNSIYQHTIMKIENITEEGNLILKMEKTKVSEK